MCFDLESGCYVKHEGESVSEFFEDLVKTATRDNRAFLAKIDNFVYGVRPGADALELTRIHMKDVEKAKRDAAKMKGEENMGKEDVKREKTQEELKDEINELHKHLKNLQKYQQYEESANELAAARKAYTDAGFSEEEAFMIVMELLKKCC